MVLAINENKNENYSLKKKNWRILKKKYVMLLHSGNCYYRELQSQVKKKILEVIPSMEFTKSSKHQHINVVFLIFFSTLDSIFIDFKDAKRHKTCIIHGFKLFE